MNYNEEEFYIEIYLSAILKVSSKDKKEKVKKLQKLLNEIVEDEILNFVKSDQSLTVLTEAEMVQSIMPLDDSIN